MANQFRVDEIVADDVVVVEGFVMFVLLTDDGTVEKNVAMFNAKIVCSVVEIRNDD